MFEKEIVQIENETCKSALVFSHSLPTVRRKRVKAKKFGGRIFGGVYPKKENERGGRSRGSEKGGRRERKRKKERIIRLG